MNSFHSNMLMILAIFSYPSACCMWNILVLPSEHSGSYGTGYPHKGYQNSGSGWWIAACRRIVWKCWQMQPASGATWCDHGSCFFGEDEMIEGGPEHLKWELQWWSMNIHAVCVIYQCICMIVWILFRFRSMRSMRLDEITWFSTMHINQTEGCILWDRKVQEIFC